MKRIQVVLLPTLVLAGILIPQPSPAQNAYTVTERGADYKVLQKVTVESGTNHVHKYTELATGMNYTNGYGQWTESKEQITIQSDGGAAATEGQHQVYFPADIYNGVLEVVTPDGRHLSSRPLAVSYDDGSNTVFIATLTNAVGWLTASNQVTYRNCFDGIKADLVCTYRRGGFECDLVFREQPPAPDNFGLDMPFTTLQLITEFFNTQDPQQIPAASDEWFGLQDETLKFGKMTMGRGKAFAVGSQNSQPSTLNSQPVYKSWLHLSGRTFLVEQVPLVYVADDLDALPLTSSIQKPKIGSRMFAYNHCQFPPAHGVLQCTNQILIASADFNKQPGVVLDYNEVSSGGSSMTFSNGQTYLVDGYCYFDESITFEPGAVLKYTSDGEIWVGEAATVTCNTTANNPAIFTSVNDYTAGEWFTENDSVLTPSVDDVGCFLQMVDTPDDILKHLRFSYGGWGVCKYSGNLELWDCQFKNIGGAIDARGLALHNVLFSDIRDDCVWLWGSFSGEHVTVDQADSFVYYDDSNELAGLGCLTNSLLTGMHYGFWGITNHTVTLDSGTGVFQTAANARYYLATNSPYRNIGTTNISTNLLAELQTLTTYAPQDGGYLDSDTPDLGYHYPVNEDSDHDGIPDWWEYYWFGNLTHSGSDLDANGNTLLQDYQSYLNGSPLDPNPIVFTISVANNYVNTSYPALQLNVTAGTPYYYTVQMDNTNFETATNWTAYTSSTITANLGATEGWHELWVGLRGLPDDAQKTWQWKRLKLDTTPPQIVITSPTNSTVDVPMIQLKGYSQEELDHISCDVSNALGVVTNLDAGVTDRYHDAIIWEFTTNYFECLDIELTNGVNVVTVHATDLAGNEMVTNFSFTLDYSSRTNPPAIRLFWPQNEEKISGSEFTWRGWVDDPTARVTAAIVDTNGTTNTVSGVVERNGNFWVEHLPMSAGTNCLMLTVTDAANQTGMTNILVSPCAFTVTMTPIPDNQLWKSKVTATGSISDSSQSLWINGVKAVVASGSWTAENVPIAKGGMAIFDIICYEPGELQPDGSTNNATGN